MLRSLHPARSLSILRILFCLVLVLQSSAVAARPAARGAISDQRDSPRRLLAASSTLAACPQRGCLAYLPLLATSRKTAPPAPPTPPTTPTPPAPSATPTPPSPPSSTPTPLPPTPPAPPAPSEVDTQAPIAPQHLRAASKSDTSISLAWDAATDNVGVSGYELFVGATRTLTTTTTAATRDGLQPGTTYTFTVTAFDAAGNVSAKSEPIVVTTTAPQSHEDLRAPTAPRNLRVTAKTHGSIDLAWDASDDDVGIAQYDVMSGDAWLGSSAAPELHLSGLTAATGYSVQIYASDAAGNYSDPSAPVAVTTDLPPSPAAVAPATDTTVVGDIASDTAFLYSGADPIQVGVAPGTISAERVAILRGRVIDRDGQPLPGVQIGVLSHSEYGQTATRSDGYFDLAVNGGDSLTIAYTKPGFLPAQRQTDTPWRDYEVLPEVALVALDPAVTTIALGEDSPPQIAASSVVSDSSGARQALLMFPAGTSATLEYSTGWQQPLTSLHVRATEYTVGEHGPAAMPGTLPANSGYTYAVEYSVDEAIAPGARQVRFSQPVIAYVENFLHFPVGEAVPAGYYDRERAAWVPSDSGRIVKIVGVTDARAVLDLDGDGDADDVAAAQIPDAERAQLAGRYSIGQELWRVPIPHFTPWDFN